MRHVSDKQTKIYNYVDNENPEMTVSYWGQTMGEECVPHGIGLAVTECGNLIEASFDRGRIIDSFFRYIVGLNR